METTNKPDGFSNYQKFIIALLTILQFTVVLDFMVLSPLSAILLTELSITTTQFGLAVSAYAFSAGISGVLVAGFADKFDRKKLLLFFYGGFIIGTFLCGAATNYHFLLVARIITGLFGGVLGSISFAIITDLFPLSMRGRVMGYVQMAFAASQVMGIPIGLYLATIWNWHSPFILIASLSIIVALLVLWKMQPITYHLALQTAESPLRRLIKTVSKPQYLPAFAATTLLATGGFMLMPFGSAFSVHNLGISLEELPLVYMVTGVCTLIAGPLLGKLSDKTGKYRLFVGGSILSMILVLIYTNLGITPLVVLIALNCVLFIGITSRIISASALMTAVPEAKDRGAFMSVNSAVQQVSGGIASAAAGMIILQTASGHIERYPILGFVVVGSMIVAIILMYIVNRYVFSKHSAAETEFVAEPATQE